MKKIHFSLAALIAIIFASCTSTARMDEFTYTYSMENVNNFKIVFELDSDSTFKVTQHNFFFDKFEKKEEPIVTEGKLNSTEFSNLKRLLEKSNITRMKDSYGFDDVKTTDSDILYMIELEQNGESKYISINASANTSFPSSFTELIIYTNTIITDKQKEE